MEPAEKLSVTVTPAMAKMIREKVEAGSFGSASEVVRAGLRALGREETEHAERIAAIKAQIKGSVDDPRPGVPIEDVFRALRAKLDQIAEERGDVPTPGRIRR